MDLITAKAHLQALLDARLAILQGAQEYEYETPSGGKQRVKRADLKQISEQIKHLQAQISALTSPKTRRHSLANHGNWCSK